jgi:hypothetical protein
MQSVSWSTKFRVTRNHRNKIIFQYPQKCNILFLKTTLSLAPACTHKHKIISFHNTLMTNLSITYISLLCVCLISMFLSNLSKLHLFTSHIYFQFRVLDHIDFKLTHRTRRTSDFNILYLPGKIRR